MWQNVGLCGVLLSHPAKLDDVVAALYGTITDAPIGTHLYCIDICTDLKWRWEYIPVFMKILNCLNKIPLHKDSR